MEQQAERDTAHHGLEAVPGVLGVQGEVGGPRSQDAEEDRYHALVPGWHDADDGAPPDTTRRQRKSHPLGQGIQLSVGNYVATGLHCGRSRGALGYVAAAVAHSDWFAGLGIDAEQNQGLPKGVMTSTCRAGELAASGPPQLALDTLLFSAKEAIFKAWYPLTATWLEPLDVYVTLRFLSPPS